MIKKELNIKQTKSKDEQQKKKSFREYNCSWWKSMKMEREQSGWRCKWETGLEVVF